MTANMSKSIKYCGNQFDLVTLRFDCVLGFIYCVRSPASTSATNKTSKKATKRENPTRPQTKRKENVIKHIRFWHHSGSSWAGIPGPSVRWAPDKDKKCYVNFVGTDGMSKPQSEIYDSLAKLEIYLFTRPVRGHMGYRVGSWIGGGVFVSGGG